MSRLALLTVAALLVGASACGGGDKAGALGKAADACSAALKPQAGQGDDALTQEREKAANLAAKAAAADGKWKELAKAVNDYAVTTSEIVDATKNISSVSASELQAIGDRLASAKRDLTATCRAVKAAGGKFEGL